MTKRDQLIVVLVVAGLALAGFYVELLKPELKKSKDLGAALTTQQARRATALSAVTGAQAAEAAYRPNLAAIGAAQIAIPPSDKTSSLLDQLDAAARQARVDFSTITLGSGSSAPTPAPSGAAAAGGASPSAAGSAGAAATSTTGSLPPGYTLGGAAGLPTATYSLTFAGDYLKLQKFLAAMQHFVILRDGNVRAHGRLINVQGITVAKGLVSMTVSAYLLAPSDQAPLPVPRTTPQTAPATGSASQTAAVTTGRAANVAAVTGGNG